LAIFRLLLLKKGEFLIEFEQRFFGHLSRYSNIMRNKIKGKEFAVQ